MIKNYLKLLVALVFATNVMAQNIPSYVPKDGLVGWWPFNGNANDESGNTSCDWFAVPIHRPNLD